MGRFATFSFEAFKFIPRRSIIFDCHSLVRLYGVKIFLPELYLEARQESDEVKQDAVFFESKAEQYMKYQRWMKEELGAAVTSAGQQDFRRDPYRLFDELVVEQVAHSLQPWLKILQRWTDSSIEAKQYAKRLEKMIVRLREGRVLPESEKLLSSDSDDNIGHVTLLDPFVVLIGVLANRYDPATDAFSKKMDVFKAYDSSYYQLPQCFAFDLTCKLIGSTARNRKHSTPSEHSAQDFLTIFEQEARDARICQDVRENLTDQYDIIREQVELYCSQRRNMRDRDLINFLRGKVDTKGPIRSYSTCKWASFSIQNGRTKEKEQCGLCQCFYNAKLLNKNYGSPPPAKGKSSHRGGFQCAEADLHGLHQRLLRDDPNSVCLGRELT